MRQWAGGLAAVLAGVLGAALAVPDVVSAAEKSPGIVAKDGVTQPVFSVDDAVRETVRVQSAMDSDGDGQLDKISVRIIRPQETGSGLKVATVMNASPYWRADNAAALRKNSDRGRVIAPAARWESWLDDYFVPRGYATLEVEIAGTGNSEGCLDAGGPADQQSVAAVIDWLNGRATASYADGTPAVASWSTGNVGMYGFSYDGTLAIQQASTGIAGLKTIVPVGAISSWYDYTRAQGINYHNMPPRWGGDFASWYSSPRAQQICKAKYRKLGDDWAADGGNYTPFFAERNYRDSVKNTQASVFLVHGLIDETVRTTEFGPYWEQLVAHNVPRKLLLHYTGHYDPSGRLENYDVIGRWMDHWLYGLDNTIMQEPQVSVEDWTYPSFWVQQSAWPLPDANQKSLYFGPPSDGGAGRLVNSPVQGSQQFTGSTATTESMLLDKPGTAQPYRLAYLGPTLTSDLRMSGTGRVELTFTSATTSTPLTAMLVQYHEGWATRVIARGSLAAKNRESLTTTTPLVPGQQATGSIQLSPTDFRIAAGSQIGLLLTSNVNNYVEPDRNAGQVSVNLGASRLVLPLSGVTEPTEPPQPVCADPAWDATAVYLTNNVVSHGGHRWRAQWWTQNQEPGTTGQWGPWADLGSC